MGKPDDAAGALTDTTSFMRSPARIRVVLLVLTTLIVGSIGYESWVEATAHRQTALARAIQRIDDLSNQVQTQTESTFRQAGFAAEALALIAKNDLARNGNFGDDTRDYVRRMVNDTTPFRNLVVAGANGVVMLDTTGEARGFDIHDRDYFAIHTGAPGRETFISSLYKSRIQRGWFVAVSRRITAPDGSFAGVAFAVIDTRYFEKKLYDIPVGAEGFTAILTQNGATLIRLPPNQRAAGNPLAFSDQSSMETVGDIGKHKLVRSPVDGVERWVLSRQLAGLPLSISVGLAQHEILRDWEGEIPSHIVVATAKTLLVCGLAVVLILYLNRFEATSNALRAAERRSRALFDSTFEYIGMLAPDGTILSINHAIQELAGIDGDSHIGAPIWSLPPWSRAPSAMRQTREAVRHAARGDFVRYESELTSRDGIRTMDISIKPIRDDAGVTTLLIAEARDVTDRKNVENNLRVSESRLRSYFEAAMESILVTNRLGRFIDANPAACRMLGFERSTLMSKSLADVLPEVPDAATVAASHLLHVMESGAYRGELRLRRSDGAVRITEVSAARLEGDVYLGIFRDVTERRRDVEALRASNARIAALLRTVPDLVFLLDESGQYLEVVAPPNDLRLAVAAERMIGKRPHEVLPLDVAQGMMQAIAEAIATQHVVTTEFQLVLSEGLRWFEARFSAMTDVSSKEMLVLQITRDITERVEAGERLAAAKEQAETANRAKSAFLATMSHELRTPLNAIIGFSEIMRSEMFGPLNNDRYKGYLDNIFDSGSHLLALINDVLDISKLEAGKYALEEESINLHNTLWSSYELQEAAAAAGDLTFNCLLPPDLPSVFGDERAVRQVLLNLLSNAIKFTPPGGTVTLSAFRLEEGGIALSVADTGIGIPADAMTNIAQPFHQVDNSVARRFGGTGLGLAISRNLMELHGGHLSIDSAEGLGTTVKAIFPASRVIGNA